MPYIIFFGTKFFSFTNFKSKIAYNKNRAHYIYFEVFKIYKPDSEHIRQELKDKKPSGKDEQDNLSLEEENDNDILSKDTGDEVKKEKIETCYFCLQKFDINQDDLSHYKYGKFPMCDYCSQFYGFYDEKKIK